MPETAVVLHSLQQLSNLVRLPDSLSEPDMLRSAR